MLMLLASVCRPSFSVSCFDISGSDLSSDEVLVGPCLEEEISHKFTVALDHLSVKELWDFDRALRFLRIGRSNLH